MNSPFDLETSDISTGESGTNYYHNLFLKFSNADTERKFQIFRSRIPQSWIRMLSLTVLFTMVTVTIPVFSLKPVFYPNGYIAKLYLLRNILIWYDSKINNLLTDRISDAFET